MTKTVTFVTLGALAGVGVAVMNGGGELSRALGEVLYGAGNAIVHFAGSI